MAMIKMMITSIILKMNMIVTMKVNITMEMVMKTHLTSIDQDFYGYHLKFR